MPVAIDARKDSRCPSCGEPIHEGDRIVFDEDDEVWVCEDCGDWL